jgi:endonuclease VIII
MPPAPFEVCILQSFRLMEGPSLVILKEEAAPFTGKKILEATGTSKADLARITGQKVTALKTWGKHFLIQLEDCTIKIHYLMFGSYRINERHPEKTPTLSFVFKNGEWNNYTCAVKLLEETDLDKIYDWTCDLMQDEWSPAKAKKKILAAPDRMICDVLLDQEIFSGLGNIMKNETLFRARIHPESKAGAIPTKQLNALIKEARIYAFDFLRWKKEFVLRKHWEAHKKTTCPRCKIPIVKEHTGKNPRRSFFCTNCQVKYE